MNKYRKSLADRIKELRAASDLSQDAFAERAKISLRGLQDIEYKRTIDPKVSTIWGISQATGVSIDEIVRGDGSKSPGLVDINAVVTLLSKLASTAATRRALVFSLLFEDPIYLEGLSPETRAALSALLKTIEVK